MSSNGSLLLGVDVGGTFTDAVAFGAGALHTAKVPTTTDDQAEGVIAAVEAVLMKAGAGAGEVEAFAHGMTVGTNALLERRGARTALVATRGFADVLEIARQRRPSLYHLCELPPQPVVGRELRFEIGERVGPQGAIETPTDAELDRLCDELAGAGVGAVAVCLLFSYAEPAHERLVAERIRERLPGVHVSASHEVLAKFREYERWQTTAIDAYLAPLLGDYLGRLIDRAATAGLPEPLVMRSSGGLATASEASRGGAWSVLSGPAGGAVGAALVARAAGEPDAVALDTGGTSCDVCLIEAGAVGRTDSREIDGLAIELPAVDVHTVGAGGGSVGWPDPQRARRSPGSSSTPRRPAPPARGSAAS